MLKSCHDTNRGIPVGDPTNSRSPAFGGARAALVKLLAVAGLVAACAGPTGNDGGQATALEYFKSTKRTSYHKVEVAGDFSQSAGTVKTFEPVD